MAFKLTRMMQSSKLQALLTRLRCPPFLNVEASSEREQSVLSSAFRRTLLLWLFAVYQTPSVRLFEEETWTRYEPSTQELLQWLHMLGVQDGDALVEGELSVEVACAQLLLVVECVHGRILLEEKGEQASLLESFNLLDDIATHAESIFDARCEIFPVSIQMIVNADSGAPYDPAKVLEEIQSVERQSQAIAARITSAKDRLEALAGGTTISIDLDGSRALSKALGGYLHESMALMEQARTMLQDEVTCWLTDSTPQLMNLGAAANETYQRIDKVLQFFEHTEASAQLSRDGSSLEKAREVTTYCQEVVNRIAPDLRDQLDTLETSLAAIGATRIAS